MPLFGFDVCSGAIIIVYNSALDCANLVLSNRPSAKHSSTGLERAANLPNRRFGIRNMLHNI
nr:hypothetical protein SHINE37_80076 [Rhizobiaceae bacterium]